MDKKRQQRLALKKLDKTWAALVKTRDGHKCVICGAEKYLNAHHIYPREFKEFRWDTMNGIALCPKHHKFGLQSAHKSGLWFAIWLSVHRTEQFNYLNSKWN